jgi:ABC-type dipeptide/oligopeptide/nickel transport system ATPase component
MNTRPDIREVFLSRNHEVNERIYVHRPDLEKALESALNGPLHIVIFGESGSGKSWLYKKILKQRKANFVVVNGAIIARNKSIAKEILVAIKPPKIAKVVGYTQKGEAGISAIGFQAKVDHQKSFVYDELDPLFEAYSLLEDRSDGGTSYIILDNLELVFNSSDLMDELASILTLLDDTNFAKFKVRFILVGTRREVRDYFQTTKNLPTVANRLTSIPEVSDLSEQQVLDLLKKGFIEILKVQINEEMLEDWSKRISTMTLGNPAAIHQFCEHLANFIKDNHWNPSSSHLADAARAWLSGVLKPAYDNIETLLNEKRTELQRRNQVLYSLSKMTKRSFDYIEVQNMVKTEFPASTKGNMNIAQVLSELAAVKPNNNNPIIKKSSTKGQSYEFTQPYYLMSLRAMLKKTASETVEKLEL